ncbi:redoxin domain-containing protein [Maribacter sp. 2304DJ31-5]|uniref:redoxin domain-containing protein n=1 Tax=Maribacter sp. 2304DJ31-5 TaxID=3386273 RepID=UPI0039BCA45C
MKKILMPVMAVLALLGCNTNPEGFVIKGNLRGEIEDGTMVFLKKIGENNQPVEVDTALLAQGNFEFTGTATASPELHYIFLDKTQAYTALVVENGKINLSAQKDSLGFAKITGTVQNDIFGDYLEKSREFSLQAKSIQNDMRNTTDAASQTALRDELQELQEEYKGFELKYIKDHPNGLISALLLDRAMATKAIESEEAGGIYDALTLEIRNSKPGKRISEGLEKLKKAEEAAKKTAIGAKAPNFSGPDPEGTVIALNDVLGKVTLIDFWAAWCKPCRAENPNIVNVYNKYHDKGLNIIGVSLDRTADAWKKAIADDGLAWNQVSNIAYFNDEIAQMYNIDAIPAAFLLDENGVIVAKNLRGPELEAKIAELLN